ncbi:DoxX family protein [Rhodocytophaga aerolata]|uniref:DoxX family protein n=1 Tax=Rhodocytophaga aerolata TaxID=455078 RepID=A0ABT8RG94_9BACT|nr:DoxX family protein [Rhodocytophaga aerolata]MDO1451131.1 DoxX family protein [Rhodocytophaga aerolata]
MAFFIQLLAFFSLLWLLSKFTLQDKLRSHGLKGRIAFSLAFSLIGIIHIAKPEKLSYMINGLLPHPEFWVMLTGFVEIVLAVLLLIPRFQRVAGWAIIGYLLLVFPANIHVAIHNLPPPGGLPASPWYVWSRLFFQPLYMLWVYYWAIRQQTEKKFVPHPSKDLKEKESILSF